MHFKSNHVHTKRHGALGLTELIAIALGGMVGGGIFTILGISVAMVGVYTPLAIFAGGLLAALAAYAYIKLGVYYQDEGATYSFFKKTFPRSRFAASLIGWWVIFGYISTIALYAYTFSSYALSATAFVNDEWVRKAVAGGIIAVFALINIWSVKGMGKVEDIMVYSKLFILVVISFVLTANAHTTLPVLIQNNSPFSVMSILIVASITFVAYEGFQLVINAVKEMDTPEKSIPKAIYSAIGLAIFIYIVIAAAAIISIPFADIIANQEYALAAGAGDILGQWASNLVVFGALLATSSAISGTIFGASRQMAVIAHDRYFPAFLDHRGRHIPTNAILAMAGLAFALILIGNLKVILEFGSVTFLLVSFLMAYANHKIRHKTKSSPYLTISSMIGLAVATSLILYYEGIEQPEQLLFIGGLYGVLTLSSWAYSKRRPAPTKP